MHLCGSARHGGGCSRSQIQRRWDSQGILDWWRYLPKHTADARSLDEFKGRAVKMCIGGF